VKIISFNLQDPQTITSQLASSQLFLSILVINVYDDVLELGEDRYGIVLEKGGVDMERYLKSNYYHILKFTNSF